MTKTLLIALAVLVAGCAPQVAVFRHPQTGDEQRCENYAKTGALIFGGIGASAESVKYANCKTQWERAGYVRMGGEGVK